MRRNHLRSKWRSLCESSRAKSRDPVEVTSGPAAQWDIPAVEPKHPLFGFSVALGRSATHTIIAVHDFGPCSPDSPHASREGLAVFVGESGDRLRHRRTPHLSRSPHFQTRGMCARGDLSFFL